MENKNDKLMKAVDLLKILSHPVRLSILCNLYHEGEMSAGALVDAERGRSSQSQVSQFLGLMREQGLVTTRKDGQSVYYKIASSEAAAVIAALYKVYCKR